MRTETNLKTGKTTTLPDAPITYIPETPTQANARKDAQVESEFTPVLLAILNIIDPSVIAQAKVARRVELDAE